MPASELNWGSRDQIFSVFGNKRKASEDVSVMDVHNCVQQEQVPKRRCQWSQENCQAMLPSAEQNSFTQQHFTNNNLVTHSSEMPTAFADHCNGMELNHNSPEMEDQHAIYERQQKQHQVSNPALSQVLSQQPPRVPSPWPSHQPMHQMASQEQYVMDVNGETYNQSASSAAESEAAQSNMDSDYSPDPQQYHSSAHEMSPNSSFCNSYCGSGDQSPSSGRIRCYCKPSWEGMLDMKPYVTDVY